MPFFYAVSGMSCNYTHPTPRASLRTMHPAELEDFYNSTVDCLDNRCIGFNSPRAMEQTLRNIESISARPMPRRIRHLTTQHTTIVHDPPPAQGVHHTTIVHDAPPPVTHTVRHVEHVLHQPDIVEYRDKITTEKYINGRLATSGDADDRSSSSRGRSDRRLIEDRSRNRSRSRTKDRRDGSRDRSKDRRDRSRSKERSRKDRSGSRDRRNRSRSREKSKKKDRSRSRNRGSKSKRH
jgi:hypothetical protein